MTSVEEQAKLSLG